MGIVDRAKKHAALGDPRRLLIVDQLTIGDRTVAELAGLVDLPGNLLAHHLDVLDEAGMIERNVSEGDHRRRYVSLRWDEVPSLDTLRLAWPERVAFVCTHNSARSQFAAAVWREVTGIEPATAGTHPAARVHPKAVRIAAEHGLDIADATPAGYESLPDDLDLVVSVCDRAREAGTPKSALTLHWSVRDPVPVGTLAAFRSSFEEIARRVEKLKASTR